MMKFALIVNLASAAADLHLDANSTSPSACLPNGKCMTGGNADCCSGCFHEAYPICGPTGVNPFRCGPCDAPGDAVPKALPAAVPEANPEASFDAFQDELSNVKPKTYVKDGGMCVKDNECAGSWGTAIDCCSLHAHRTLACGVPLPEGGASIGWRCDPASLDEVSGDDSEDALASTVEETIEVTSACISDGDCIANPDHVDHPGQPGYYCCSKTAHWTERCGAKYRCGAADTEDSQNAFALV